MWSVISRLAQAWSALLASPTCAQYSVFLAAILFVQPLGWTCGVFLQHLWRLWGVGVVRLALGSCLAFVCFFMLSIGGCLRVWCIGAQASPSHKPLLPELGIKLGGPFGSA